MAVCKNLWLKQLGKNSRMMGEEQIKPQAHSETPVGGQAMDLKKIHEALDELGDTCKNILVMFYFDGYDMDTIAKSLQFNNADTAKAKKYQCFKKLEEIVKRRYKMTDFLR
jgi:DNA-directed RNA polymerase specialized sigma24 family protein